MPSFWDEIGRALQAIFDTLENPEAPPDPADYYDDPHYEGQQAEYEQGEFGLGDLLPDFFSGGDDGGDDYGDSPYYDDPDEPFIYHAGDGPYPDNWDGNMQYFWDEVVEGRAFNDQQNYDDAQYDFYQGFINPDLDTDERVGYREDFLVEMDMIDFDWEAFRDYWGY